MFRFGGHFRGQGFGLGLTLGFRPQALRQGCKGLGFRSQLVGHPEPSKI